MTDQLKYPGTAITPRAGDVVRFSDDQQTMTVEEVIATKKDRERWGMEESGIMMIGPKYGRVFDQLDTDSEVELVERPEKES